jgi:hypothetical protein
LAVEAIDPWDEVALSSLYGETKPDELQASNGIARTKEWWRRLQETGDSALVAGRIA